MAAIGPALMLTWERVAPSYVSGNGFAPIMRLTGVISVGAGFFSVYQRSICTKTSIRKRKRNPRSKLGIAMKEEEETRIGN